jgi:predicted nucleic acid-binding protein
MKPPLMCVTDTNIWIDLENGEVLELIFELPYQFITSDFAADELNATLWASLEALGVEAYGLSSEQINDIFLLNQNHHAVSTTDISCLVLARDLLAILLSGDNPLRKLAENHAVKVHGVLWLLDALVVHQLIIPGQACNALKRMLARSARLPVMSYIVV